MLNLLYLAFFLVTLPFAVTRNRLFGFYYTALYLYSAFALAGYLYFPGISESLQAYFGDDVGHTSLAFIFVSMIAFWSVNMFLYRPRRPARAWLTVAQASSITSMGKLALFSVTVAFGFLLFTNFASLSWYIFEFAESLSPEIRIFILFYKTSVGIITVVYAIIRSNEIRKDALFSVTFFILLILFIIASFKLGNRTDPAAVICGIIFYEAIRRRLSFRVIASIGAVLIISVATLSLIEHFRYVDGISRNSLAERIFLNDYYAPAHMLFAAIAFDYVAPTDVIRSNTANALILLGEPYLQQLVTELFRSDVASRSEGYAFYILTEGWIFGGWGGVIYNALIPTFGLWLWSRLACTDNRLVNTLVLVLAACMVLNVTRGQSSYFIKYAYTFILPNLIFAAVFIGLRVRIGRGKETVPRFEGQK